MRCVSNNVSKFSNLSCKTKYKDKQPTKKYKPRDQCKRNKLALMPLCTDFFRRLPYERRFNATLVRPFCALGPFSSRIHIHPRILVSDSFRIGQDQHLLRSSHFVPEPKFDKLICGSPNITTRLVYCVHKIKKVFPDLGHVFIFHFVPNCMATFPISVRLARNNTLFALPFWLRLFINLMLVFLSLK